MSENIHMEGRDIRNRVLASNFNIYIFNSWKAEVIRERRHSGGFLIFFDSWEREETPLNVQVTFSEVDGTAVGPFPPDQSSTGYRAIESSKFFFGNPQPNPPVQPDHIVGIQVDYDFDGRHFTLTEGVNYVSQLVAIILIIIVVVIIAIFAWPLLAKIAMVLGL